MSKGKREQTQNAESIVNTRQDRNTFITDGGTWTWNAGTGTLTWSATINIRRGGVVLHQITAGSVAGMTFGGNVAYVDVSRTAGGVVTMEGGTSPGPLLDLDNSANSTDERLIVGVVGGDGKFYMRDTIFGDGDSKALGTLNATTDRGDIAASGNVTDTVPFSYVVGSDQLAVYVGGLLMEETLHYTESSTTTIDWTTLGQPLVGERVSFVNIVGGQGPSGGTGSLQSAYGNGESIDTTAGSAVRIVHTAGSAAFGVHDSLAGTPNVVVNGDGTLFLNAGNAGLVVLDNGGTDYWGLVPRDDGTDDFLLYNNGSGEGIRIDKLTGAIEHGSYAGSYPGGAWTPDGSGGLKWALFTGTIDAAGAPTTIATSLSNIVGLALSVGDAGTGNINAFDVANPQVTAKRIAAFFSGSTVTLAGDLAQTQAIGSHLRSEAFTLIVFYQG